MTPEDLDHLIAEEGPRIRAFLRRLAPRDAEDLCQDVLEKALRYRKAFDPGGSLHGWLIKTAFRTYLDFRRRGERIPKPAGDGIFRLRAPADGQAENRELLAGLLESLPTSEREILERFHLRQESVAEIAEALGMPAGTVKSRLHRARRKLTKRADGSFEA